MDRILKSKTVVLVCGLVLLAAACGEVAPPPPPPVEVVVTEVARRDVPIAMEWIGTTEGAVDAVIRAEV